VLLRGERKTSAPPPAAGGLRGGAMALGSRRSSLTFARAVGPVFFILQIISVRADGESPLRSGWVAGAGRRALC